MQAIKMWMGHEELSHSRSITMIMNQIWLNFRIQGHLRLHVRKSGSAAHQSRLKRMYICFWMAHHLRVMSDTLAQRLASQEE